jgi:hypothetical protein
MIDAYRAGRLNTQQWESCPSGVAQPLHRCRAAHLRSRGACITVPTIGTPSPILPEVKTASRWISGSQATCSSNSLDQACV